LTVLVVVLLCRQLLLLLLICLLALSGRTACSGSQDTAQARVRAVIILRVCMCVNVWVSRVCFGVDVARVCFGVGVACV
jgi:hypothetical protein